MYNLNLLFKKYKIKDLINILYFHFLIESNYIYKISQEEINKIYSSIKNVTFEDIAFLYKMYFIDLKFKEYFINKKDYLKKINTYFSNNIDEKEKFLKLLSYFIKKIYPIYSRNFYLLITY